MSSDTSIGNPVDVLMDDGTWESGGEIVLTGGIDDGTLIRWDGLEWWAAPDEWRQSDAR